MADAVRASHNFADDTHIEVFTTFHILSSLAVDNLQCPAPIKAASLWHMKVTTNYFAVQDAPLVEKKHRKSVAFSEGTTIMDANGAISEASHSDDKTTAERHSASMS